jgi:hypothetical protein
VLGDGHGRVYWLVLDELVPLRSGGVERELRSSLVAERRRVACPERREVDANQLVEIICSRRAEASGRNTGGVHGLQA